MTNSVTEFFDADPLSLTRENFEAIIEHYRQHRLNFQIAARTSVSTAAQKKTAAALEKAKNLAIDIDSIEL